MALALLVCGVVFLAPETKLQHPRVRFIQKPLKISVSKSNPPRLAFEEALRIRDTPALPVQADVKQVPGVSLNALIGSRSLRPTNLALYYRQVTLDTMVIERPARNQPIQQTQIPINALSMKLSDARAGQSTDQSPTRDFGPDVPEQSFEAPVESGAEWYHGLTPRQKRLVDSSGLTANQLSQAQMEPSLAQALAAKVEEELRSMQVEKPTSLLTSLPTQKVITKAGPVKAAGHLSTDNLAPFLPDHHFEVHWIREGVSQKSGRVVLQPEVKFEIEIPELIGSVRAEMYDRNGQVVAAGNLRLSSELSPQVLNNLQLHLRPVRQVASYYKDFYSDSASLFAEPARKISSWSKKTITTKASFDENTSFESDGQGQLFIDSVSANSTSYAISESTDYYPALHMLTAGQKDALPMIPKKTANALLEIIEEQMGYTSLQKNGALVLGQVTSAGAPIVGAQVVLEGHPEARAIYLNEILIPDPKLTASTSSGYFVFVHLPEGFYSIRANKGAQFIGYGNVLNEPDAAAFVELQEAQRFAPFELRAFDAFSGEGQSTELHVQALNQDLAIDGYGEIEHPVLAKLSLIEANPSAEYMPATYPYSANSEYAHLPLIPRLWMEGLIARSRVNVSPGSGTILGFNEKGGYEISLPHLAQENRAQIIYFDSEGHEVPAAVDQGGFILVNLPQSAQTVVLRQALGSVTSQVLNADADRLTVSRFVF